MEDIKLVIAHGPYGPQNVPEGIKVPSCFQEKTSMRVYRIFDDLHLALEDKRVNRSGISLAYELRECLQASDGSPWHLG